MLNLGRKGGIVGIILVIIAGMVIIGILFSGISGKFKAISMIFDKYSPPKVQLNNTFYFTANDISTSSCGDGEITGSKYQYNCKTSTPVDFAIDVTNSGLKDRRYNPGAVICKYPSKDCCNDKDSIIVYDAQYCEVAKGTKELCDITAYTFKTPGKYEVHPIVECSNKDQLYGCYSPGMTETIKSCNADKYIILSVTTG